MAVEPTANDLEVNATQDPSSDSPRQMDVDAAHVQDVVMNGVLETSQEYTLEHEQHPSLPEEPVEQDEQQISSEETPMQDGFLPTDSQPLVEQSHPQTEELNEPEYHADSPLPATDTAQTSTVKPVAVPTPPPEPTPHPRMVAEPIVPLTPSYKTKFIMSGHTKSISSVKFSPDGVTLASCAADKLVKLWDIVNGEIIDTLEGHTAGISDIAWSSDGELLASASDDKTIRIWSMETGTAVKVLQGHTNFVFCLNFNPACNLLASGGFDETVRVWDVARGRPLKTLPAHSDPVTSVVFNHDGTLLASCAMDGLIRIWDTESGQCLKTLADDDNPICSHIKFSPNSLFILASTQDSTIRLWNTETTRCVKTYLGHTNRTYSIFCDFAPGGEYIISGSEDCKIYFWNLQTRQIASVLEGHRDVVIAVASHPTQHMIASAALEKDMTIRVWVDENYL